MASAVDNYSDLELSDSENEKSDLEKNFNLAANVVKRLAGSLQSAQLLELYALFKQVTIGPCNVAKPSFFDMQARKKWDAWAAIKDMSSNDAKSKYVQLVAQLDPTWNSSSSSEKSHWVCVSTLADKSYSNESDFKNVFDYCKLKQTARVEEFLNGDSKIMSQLDDGLGLIHWAADRDCVEILELLLKYGCDVNMRDESGQTALHYATSCGNINSMMVLLKHGADKTLLDSDGLTPLDVASEEIHEFKHLLQ